MDTLADMRKQYLAAVKQRDAVAANRLLDQDPELEWDISLRTQLNSEDLKWVFGIHERP